MPVTVSAHKIRPPVFSFCVKRRRNLTSCLWNDDDALRKVRSAALRKPKERKKIKKPRPLLSEPDGQKREDDFQGELNSLVTHSRFHLGRRGKKLFKGPFLLRSTSLWQKKQKEESTKRQKKSRNREEESDQTKCSAEGRTLTLRLWNSLYMEVSFFSYIPPFCFNIFFSSLLLFGVGCVIRFRLVDTPLSLARARSSFPVRDQQMERRSVHPQIRLFFAFPSIFLFCFLPPGFFPHSASLFKKTCRQTREARDLRNKWVVIDDACPFSVNDVNRKSSDRMGDSLTYADQTEAGRIYIYIYIRKSQGNDDFVIRDKTRSLWEKKCPAQDQQEQAVHKVV